MADETYKLPESPVYREDIRRLQNSDPANADTVFNPLMEAVLENIHAVKLAADGLEDDKANATHTHTADQVTETDALKIMTAAEREKLVGVQAGATNYQHPASHPATMITEDATHRFATDAEKSAWNSKASITTVAVTLTAAGWTGSGPYTQTLTVSGVTASSGGDIGLAQTATAAQREAARDAMLSVTGQAANSVTVIADGDKPGVDIPVTVQIIK